MRETRLYGLEGGEVKAFLPLSRLLYTESPLCLEIDTKNLNVVGWIA